MSEAPLESELFDSDLMDTVSLLSSSNVSVLSEEHMERSSGDDKLMSLRLVRRPSPRSKSRLKIRTFFHEKNTAKHSCKPDPKISREEHFIVSSNIGTLHPKLVSIGQIFLFTVFRNHYFRSKNHHI